MILICSKCGEGVERSILIKNPVCFLCSRAHDRAEAKKRKYIPKGKKKKKKMKVPNPIYKASAVYNRIQNSLNQYIYFEEGQSKITDIAVKRMNELFNQYGLQLIPLL